MHKLNMFGEGAMDDAKIGGIFKAVEQLEEEKAEELVKEAIAEGIDPNRILQIGVEAGVRSIGERFQKGEYFIAELVIGGDIAQNCVAILEPELAKLPATEMEKRREW